MKRKVLLVTEFLNAPYDEGIKKTVFGLFKELERTYEVLVICRFGNPGENIEVIDTNPLFLSRRLYHKINHFKPDVTIYFPFQSSTFASYLRQYILRSFSISAISIFIALQPKVIKKWQNYLASVLFQGIALTPSQTLSAQWNSIGMHNYLIPLNTDLEKFSIQKEEKIKSILREKYELPLDAFIVSHMGHLNEGRNLRSLIGLKANNNCQIVLVSSSSTPSDAIGTNVLRRELIDAGIIIIDRTLEHIEEIYQLSDLYIFPVLNENSSIGMPLSILEARACGIPVLTTDYGSVRHYFDDDFGGIFYTEPDNFAAIIDRIRSLKIKEFTKSKIHDINNIFYNKIHQIINAVE